MKSQLFIKKFTTRPVAHAFEHVIAIEFEKYIFQKYNYFEYLDYKLYCKTHDNYAFFKIKAESKILNEFANFKDKIIFSQDTVNRALKEISIEWQYQYTVNLDNLTFELKQNAKKSWLDLAKIKITLPPKNPDWQLRSKNLWYQKSKTAKIAKIDIDYEFEAAKNDMISKIIAAYLINTIKTTQINLCYSNPFKISKPFVACYDLESDWHDYPYEEDPLIVQFYHQLGFLEEDAPNIKILEEFYLKNQQKLIENNFINKAIEFIKTEIENDNDFYLEEDFFIRTGVYFDKQELLNQLTKERVKSIFDQIKIKFALVK